MRTLITLLLGRTAEPSDTPAGEPVRLLTREQMGEVAGGTTTATVSFGNTVTGADSADGTGTATVSTRTGDTTVSGTVQIVLTGEAAVTA